LKKSLSYRSVLRKQAQTLLNHHKTGVLRPRTGLRKEHEGVFNTLQGFRYREAKDSAYICGYAEKRAAGNCSRKPGFSVLLKQKLSAEKLALIGVLYL